MNKYMLRILLNIEILCLALFFGFSTPVFADTPPIEFVTQILEPTGGKMDRPKDWNYYERHGGPVYRWIICKEDLSKGGDYLTGVQIQCFSNIQKGVGKTAKEFIYDFFNKKKADPAVKVISSCDPHPDGLFTQMCLETEEGKFHIQYGLYWMTGGGDIAVVFIAGAPKELWDTYAGTFKRMGTFELIDMKRFEK